MPSVAQIVAGEASSLAGMQAVINVMQNRLDAGFSGSSGGLYGIANAPGQFVGSSNNAGAVSQAQSLLDQNAAGNLPDITGGALYYVSPVPGSSYGGVAGATGPATAGILSAGNNIGGNYFSDQWGAPSQGYTTAPLPPPNPFSTPYGNSTNLSMGSGASSVSVPNAPLSTGSTDGTSVPLPGQDAFGSNILGGTGNVAPGSAASGDVTTGLVSSDGLSASPSDYSIAAQPSITSAASNVSGLWEYTGAQATSAGDSTIGSAVAKAATGLVQGITKATQASAKTSAGNTAAQDSTQKADTWSLTSAITGSVEAALQSIRDLFIRGGLLVLAAVFLFGAVIYFGKQGTGG